MFPELMRYLDAVDALVVAVATKADTEGPLAELAEARAAYRRVAAFHGGQVLPC